MAEQQTRPDTKNEPFPQRQAIEEHVMRTLVPMVMVTKSRMNYDFEAAAEDTRAPTAKSPDAKLLLDQAVSLTRMYVRNTGHDFEAHAEMCNRSLHIALRANGLIPKRDL